MPTYGRLEADYWASWGGLGSAEPPREICLVFMIGFKSDRLNLTTPP